MYLTVSELMKRFPNAELDSEPERLAGETSIAFKNLPECRG